MKPSTVCLEQFMLRQLLSGDLPSDDVASAELHLSDCENCRVAIESLIADREWWAEAKSSLATNATRIQNGHSHRSGLELNEQVLDLLGPTDDPAMLGRIGTYEIVGLLGRGGMGVVFKGFDGALSRFVAIKMLQPHLATSGAARKRFAREAQAAAAVVDDHVMAIHGVSEWNSVPYFVMPYARGVSLQKRLDNDGALEVRETLRIGMQAAKGLAAAHAQGLVHRDVKPANIFLDEGVERVQLMDFGLARAVDDASLTRSGTLAGTPQYMSPEQARAESVDHRSDLFSLGSVMYAMCVGRAPFRAESSYSVLRLISDKQPRPLREINPDTPEWLCGIISKLMEKQASDRFESAEHVAELLEDSLAHVQQPTTTPLPQSVISLTKQSSSPIGRYRRWLVAAMISIPLIAAGVVIVQQSPKDSPQGSKIRPATASPADSNNAQFALATQTQLRNQIAEDSQKNDSPKGKNADESPADKIGSQRDPEIELVAGPDHVKWTRRIEIEDANTGRVQAAVVNGDAYYLAGKKYNSTTKKEVLWLWKTDLSGKRLWAKEIAAKHSPDVVELLPPLSLENATDKVTPKGIRLVYRTGVDTSIACVDDSGTFTSTVNLQTNDRIEGVMEFADGDLLFCGSTMFDSTRAMQGWVARTSPVGKFRWKQEFTPSAEADKNPAAQPKSDSTRQAIPKGLYENVAFYHGSVLVDESIVLVGQSGQLSKFGVGISKLWLLRIDANGKKIGEAFVDNAYSGLPARQPVVVSDGKLAVRHWKSGKLPKDKPIPSMSMAPWLSWFDFDMKLVSEGGTQTKLPPNSVTIGDGQPGMFPMHSGNFVALRWSDVNGAENQRVTVSSRGFMTPLMTLTGSNGVLAVSDFQPAYATPKKPPQVLLMLMQPPVVGK